MPIVSLSADNNVLFEDYYSALKNEYAKYGIEFEISTPNYKCNYTQALLDEQLKFARDFRDSIEVSVVDIDPSISLFDNENVIVPYIMPVWYKWSKQFTISSNALNVPSSLIGTVSVSGEVNVQNSLIISYYSNLQITNSINLESNGLYVTAHKTADGKSIYVNLRGSVTFAWTDPWTNSVHRATVYEPFWGTHFRADQYTM